MPPAGFEPPIPASEFSGMEGPVSSYTTVSRVLRVILINRPLNDDKIGINSFGLNYPSSIMEDLKLL
jgi:hypothetical protein